MSVIPERLGASSTRSGLLSSLRHHYGSLRDADEGIARIGNDSYEIRIPDTARGDDVISLRVPQLTRGVQVDAAIEPGLLRKGVFTVTRFGEGEIVISEATFPTMLSPLRSIEAHEVRLRPGRHDEPQYTSSFLSLADQGFRFTTEHTSGEADFPQVRVDRMLRQASDLVQRGDNAPWGFISSASGQAAPTAPASSTGAHEEPCARLTLRERLDEGVPAMDGPWPVARLVTGGAAALMGALPGLGAAANLTGPIAVDYYHLLPDAVPAMGALANLAGTAALVSGHPVLGGLGLAASSLTSFMAWTQLSGRSAL